VWCCCRSGPHHFGTRRLRFRCKPPSRRSMTYRRPRPHPDTSSARSCPSSAAPRRDTRSRPQSRRAYRPRKRFEWSRRCSRSAAGSMRSGNARLHSCSRTYRFRGKPACHRSKRAGSPSCLRRSAAACW
jgi:hypothetical protein